MGALRVPPADSLCRFSDRVANYIRYRPHYPPAMFDLLAGEFGLRPEHVVVDVGSGTGISCQPLLERGHTVVGVEPNADMRAAAEQLLARYPAFRSVAGRAEDTTLPEGGADWVLAAQAFHWFEVDACRAEFRRILRPQGRVALAWNDRRSDTPFLREYDALLKRHATDYEQVDHRHATSDGRIGRFFRGPPRAAMLDNVQRFDFEGLRGRLLSSSYVPNLGQPGCDEMLADLRRLFDRFAEDGSVVLLYDLRLYVGQLGC